jgi:hypothetical protein
MKDLRKELGELNEASSLVAAAEDPGQSKFADSYFSCGIQEFQAFQVTTVMSGLRSRDIYFSNAS